MTTKKTYILLLALSFSFLFSFSLYAQFDEFVEETETAEVEAEEAVIEEEEPALPVPPAKTHNVAVILSKDMSVQNLIFSRFKTELEKKNKVNIQKFIITDADTAGMKKQILSLAPSAIFCVGTKATFLARQIPDTPKLFTLVVNPLKEGFCTKEGDPKDDMTGISISVSAMDQFKLIKEAVPSVKRIGVVYDPAKTGNIVARAFKAADKEGLELLNLPVTESSRVPDAVDSLAGKIDVLWGVVDNTVYNRKTMEYVLLFSLKNKIPFVGFSIHQVKAGALLGVYCDYPSLGPQAATIVNDILYGKSPMDIPMQAPHIIKYALSERASKILGLKISHKLRSGADKILSGRPQHRFFADYPSSSFNYAFLSYSLR